MLTVEEILKSYVVILRQTNKTESVILIELLSFIRGNANNANYNQCENRTLELVERSSSEYRRLDAPTINVGQSVRNYAHSYNFPQIAHAFSHGFEPISEDYKTLNKNKLDAIYNATSAEEKSAIINGIGDHFRYDGNNIRSRQH